MKYVLVLLLLTRCGIALAGSPKPNVVYIMADDLGWGDISAHGGGVATPNIDRLFQEGVELTHFMGWCVCSPTRAMLLTGRHPFRVGTGPEVGGEMAKEETTIADGSTTPIWVKSKDTRPPKISNTEPFKEFKVRTVDAAEVGN